jgi:hypothetical protein
LIVGKKNSVSLAIVSPHSEFSSKSYVTILFDLLTHCLPVVMSLELLTATPWQPLQSPNMHVLVLGVDIDTIVGWFWLVVSGTQTGPQ